jgi:hypothetical protein
MDEKCANGIMRVQRRIFLGLLGGLCCAGVDSSLLGQESQEHPLVPALALARQSLAELQKVQDYEATFTKREWVGQQFVVQSMYMKLREQPFSVYLKFNEPNAGREILYVKGQNQNMLLAHEGRGIASLLGTVSLPLNDEKIRAENRYPITDIGMRRILELLIERWEKEAMYGEIEVKYFPNAKLGNIACEVVEASHPTPRNQFPFHITRMYLDQQTRYLVRVENFAFPRKPGEAPAVVEEYTFTNVRVNRGFTDADFDRRNKAYSF